MSTFKKKKKKKRGGGEGTRTVLPCPDRGVCVGGGGGGA